MKVKDFLSESDQQQIIDAIKSAELNTSGEVRLHIENWCKNDALDKAVKVFYKLEMEKTELRNGVLFFVAVSDQKFAIIGDKGINQKVPDTFWDEIKSDMAVAFQKGQYANGLSAGILKAGEQLKAHFPYQSDDINELPDEISYGE